MRTVRWFLAMALVGAGVLAPEPAAAQTLISRTITIDGDMSDWTNAPDITNNAGQFSTDCSVGQACEKDNPQSTGRDLKKFAFTWNSTHLFFYVERYASASNITEWLFYIDENADGKMQTGERIFLVEWQGNNTGTVASLCVYTAVAVGGDPLGGDGNTMPGGGSACTNLYTGSGGAASGVQMESRVSWAQLGKSGPQNVRFHISSTRNMNLPSSVEDNMNGPGGGGSGGGGGQLFPPDMAVGMAASGTQTANNQPLTLTATLQNVYYDAYTNVQVNISIPAQLTYVSHVAPVGTTFTDTNSDGKPDRWTIAALGPQGQYQLQINVRGTRVDQNAAVVASAALGSFSGSTDTNSGNNNATSGVTVLASPRLTLSHISNASNPAPEQLVIYTVLTTNVAAGSGQSVVVQTAIDPGVWFALDPFGPGQRFQFVDGSPSSGLSIGTIQYSSNGGSTWAYTPVSGGGGAPAGFDANVTNWRITMSGTMQPDGRLFEIRYAARVK